MTATELFPPRAYLIGAPKCGTTALASYLTEHPAIAFSRSKEPHIFADDLDGLKTKKTFDDYRDGFPLAAETQLLMEGSVWYLYSQVAIANILVNRPDARFIVMLRDPVRMLPSLHQQLINALDEDTMSFERAWDLSAERALGRHVPKTCRAPATLIYTRTAMFGEMIERLFRLAGRDRCLILFQEEMRVDARAVYKRVLDFLNLPSDGRTDFEPVNEAQKPRSQSLQWLLQRGGPIRERVSGPIKKVFGVTSLGVQSRLRDMNMVKTGGATISPDMAARIAAHHSADITSLCATLDRDIRAEFNWPGLPVTSIAQRASS